MEPSELKGDGSDTAVIEPEGVPLFSGGEAQFEEGEPASDPVEPKRPNSYHINVSMSSVHPDSPVQSLSVSLAYADGVLCSMNVTGYRNGTYVDQELLPPNLLRFANMVGHLGSGQQHTLNQSNDAYGVNMARQSQMMGALAQPGFRGFEAPAKLHGPSGNF